jgi:hypothetical protein
MIRVIIAIWNMNHMSFPELGWWCEKERVPCPKHRTSTTPNIGTRAKEARRLAERMIDETAKECDKFAIKAAMCSIYEVAVSRVIDETERN